MSKFIKRVSSQSGQKFYVLVQWHECHINVQAIDGSSTWSGQNLMPPAEFPKNRHDQWFKYGKLAFSETDPSQPAVQPPQQAVLASQRSAHASQQAVHASQQALSVPPQALGLSAKASRERLTLQWRWLEEGTKTKMLGQVHLLPDTDSVKVTTDVLDILYDSYALLQSSLTLMKHSLDELKQKNKTTQDELEAITKSYQEIQSKMYLQFSLLLNARKAQLREANDKIKRGETTESDDEENDSYVLNDGAPQTPQGPQASAQDTSPAPGRRKRERSVAESAASPAATPESRKAAPAAHRSARVDETGISNGPQSYVAGGAVDASVEEMVGAGAQAAAHEGGTVSMCEDGIEGAAVQPYRHAVQPRASTDRDECLHPSAPDAGQQGQADAAMTDVFDKPTQPLSQSVLREVAEKVQAGGAGVGQQVEVAAGVSGAGLSSGSGAGVSGLGLSSAAVKMFSLDGDDEEEDVGKTMPAVTKRRRRR